MRVKSAIPYSSVEFLVLQRNKIPDKEEGAQYLCAVLLRDLVQKDCSDDVYGKSNVWGDSSASISSGENTVKQNLAES